MSPTTSGRKDSSYTDNTKELNDLKAQNEALKKENDRYLKEIVNLQAKLALFKKQTTLY